MNNWSGGGANKFWHTQIGEGKMTIGTENFSEIAGTLISVCVKPGRIGG